MNKIYATIFTATLAALLFIAPVSNVHAQSFFDRLFGGGFIAGGGEGTINNPAQWRSTTSIENAITPTRATSSIYMPYGNGATTTAFAILGILNCNDTSVLETDSAGNIQCGADGGGAGGGTPDWFSFSDYMVPTTTLGIVVSASSTIEALYVQGNLVAANLTSGDIVIGGGTSPLTALDINTNGTLLIGDGSGAPTVATLTAGVDVDITNGAGSITITNGRDFDWYELNISGVDSAITPTTTVGIVVNASSTITELRSNVATIGGDKFDSDTTLTVRATTTGTVPLYVLGAEGGQAVNLFNVATSTTGSASSIGNVFAIDEVGGIVAKTSGGVFLLEQYSSTDYSAVQSSFTMQAGDIFFAGGAHQFNVLTAGSYDFDSTEDLNLALTGTNMGTFTSDTGLNVLNFEGIGLLAGASSTVVGNFNVDGQASTTGAFSVGGALDTSIASCTEALETNAAGEVVCGTDAGGGVPDWFMITGDTAIMPTTTVGIVVAASSTIQALQVQDALRASSTLVVDGYSLLAANVGIGTTSPYGNLSLNAPSGDDPYFVIGSSTEVLRVSQSAEAFLGVGSSSPWRTLSVDGTTALNGLTSATGGTNNDVCIVSATKELVEETTGVCVVSSRRFKHDIETLNISALDVVNSLRSVSFSPNEEDVADYKDTHYGLIAEEVATIDPHLVRYSVDGLPRTLDDFALISVLVKAIQEQQEQIDGMGKDVINYWPLLGLLGLLGLLRKRT